MEGDNEVRAGPLPPCLVLELISLQETEIQVKEARHKGSHTVEFHLYDMSRIRRSMETGRKLVVARGWVGRGGNEEKCLNG